ncbi:MAG TPA: undecaprenyldiphospho-muramoylpentapeptide beta-N-acetylglucosaminyltransferase, partial [Fibrobacteraceae bacterium]|nr:undecaprenyldiphospho-muramoylpentapeptide beta-N-acetylglucosaminyltransferase [Fibrobacteraceae bacterium]
MNQDGTVLIACGGTGGHIYPALAIAEAFRHQGFRHIVFAGRRNSMEEKLVAPQWPFELIQAVPLVRGNPLQNIALPWRLLCSFLSAYRVVRRLRPTFVVATGGYVSLPVLLAAGCVRVPIFLQEQNAVAGIANRIGAILAKRIFVTSSDAAQAFPTSKVRVEGNPIRTLPTPGSQPVPEAFSKARFKILVLGGSQGARGINRKIEEALPRIATHPEIAVVWQVGAKNVEKIQQRLQLPAHVHIRGFLNPVYAYIDHADLVISRAGASTLAELLAFGKPSLLFPFPFATANHQEHNARVLEKAGAALVELD